MSPHERKGVVGTPIKRYMDDARQVVTILAQVKISFQKVKWCKEYPRFTNWWSDHPCLDKLFHCAQSLQKSLRDQQAAAQLGILLENCSRWAAELSVRSRPDCYSPFLQLGEVRRSLQQNKDLHMVCMRWKPLRLQVMNVFWSLCKNPDVQNAAH